MQVLEQVAPGAVGAGLVSGAIFLVAFLLGRKPDRAPWRERGTALAVAGGFATGFAVVLTWPALPLGPGADAWTWVAWFAPAALLLGWLESAAHLPLPARLAIRLAAGAGAAWLVLAPHALLSAGERFALLAIAAVATALLWTALDRARREGPPERAALPVIVAVGATAAVLAFVSGSVSMGQVTGSLSAAFAAPLVLALVLRAPDVTAPAAPVVALVLGNLLLGAYAYLNYGDVVNFPAASALLLIASAASGALLSRALRPHVSRIASALLATLPAVLLAALAAWLAQAAAPPPSPWG